MKLYDSIIEETLGALSKGSSKCFSYEKEKPWPCLANTEFIMQRDAGPELGGSGEPSVNYTCVTTSGLSLRPRILRRVRTRRRLSRP